MLYISSFVQPVIQKVLAQSTTVTITFSPEQVITWLIIGLIAGLLASMLIRGRRYSFIGSIILGLLGALVGGFSIHDPQNCDALILEWKRHNQVDRCRHFVHWRGHLVDRVWPVLSPSARVVPGDYQ